MLTLCSVSDTLVAYADYRDERKGAGYMVAMPGKCSSVSLQGLTITKANIDASSLRFVHLGTALVADAGETVVTVSGDQWDPEMTVTHR